MDLNQLLATYAAPVTQSMFMFAFGACVGSLTNVLVYRLPRGLDVVSPPSRCPACQTRLTWRENIPVLGWLALGGRCRFCKSRISPEYPLVEAFVGLLFVALYLLWYVIGPRSVWLGVDWGQIKPEWALNGFGQTWPAFVTLLLLVSSLVAMTLVDAKTFTIPIVLTTVPAVLGLVVHPAHAAWVQHTTPGHLVRHADHEVWTIATFGPDGWRGLGAGIGGVVGLGISMLLLRFGIISRSFADYDEWERSQRGSDAPPSIAPQTAEALSAETAARASPVVPPLVDGADPAPSPPPGTDPLAPVGPRHEPSKRARESVLVYAAAVLALGVAGALLAPVVGAVPLLGLVVGALVGPVVGGLILSRLHRGPGVGASEDPADEASDGVVGDPEMWLAYPHARREMIRELVFLAPAVALGVLGAAVAGWLGGPWNPDPMTGDLLPSSVLPLWAVALGGSVMGYLLGGAVVWGVRIFGSLAFGKEAMGMGDVHLMAAVGACLGWIDATLAFFLAAFVGLYWVILVAARSGGRVDRAMPYGPYLAAATMLMIVAKPVVEHLLGRIVGQGGPIDLP